MPQEVLRAVVNGQEYKVEGANIQGGHIMPDGRPAELGKRFVCGLQLSREVTHEGKPSTIETIYASGEVTITGLGRRNVGCGTEFLVTKASSSIIDCCGKPAVLQKPKPLPSSD